MCQYPLSALVADKSTVSRMDFKRWAFPATLADARLDDDARHGVRFSIVSVRAVNVCIALAANFV